MRALIVFGLCLVTSGCMRAVEQLGPLGPVTQVLIHYHPSMGAAAEPLESERVPPLMTFIDRQRFKWTRATAAGFGIPNPVCYAFLYREGSYVGYFAVGAGVLPGSAAFFEVDYGGVYARKRITRTQANEFLDIVGAGGELR